MSKHKLNEVFLVFVLMIGLSSGNVTAADNLDMLLVRHQSHDILIMRPWLTEPPEAGLWLWPVPIGTTIAIAPDIGMNDLRSAVWRGHIPLNEPNAQRLRPLCLMSDLRDLTPLTTLVLGTFGSLVALEDAVIREDLLLTADDRRRCEEILASGVHIAAVAWRDHDGSQTGRGLPGLAPLSAVVLTVPEFLTTIPITDGRRRGSCVGELIAIGRVPLVPVPEHREQWAVGLLVDQTAAAPLAAARIAGVADADETWGVTALALQQCDDQTALSLLPLDPVRDLQGPTARLAASWCGLRSDQHHQEALRQVLADPNRSLAGFDAAFALWAWAQYRTIDSIDLLEAWADHPNALIRGEALLNLAVVDSSAAVERDLDILAAFPELCNVSQYIVDLVGARVVRSDLWNHTRRLQAIADDSGGWLEWRFAEQIGRSIIPRTRPNHLMAPDQLTAGHWAVAALLTCIDSDAISTISQALLETAILNCYPHNRSPNPNAFRHGFSSKFWNAFLILFPRDSHRHWPTLNWLEVALAERSRAKDSLVRQALRYPSLPDIAATVLLASIKSWEPGDEMRAVAILESTPDPCQIRHVRFAGIDNPMDRVEVELPLAVVGAAYVLAQRGVTAPILAALERVQDRALRSELVFALALAPRREVAVEAAIASWREEIGFLPHDDPGLAHAVQTCERIDLHDSTDRWRRRAPYSARFGTDFRTRWQR